MWLAAAFLSAVFSAMATLLIKQFVKETDSTLATALRTGVVLVIAWIIAAQAGALRDICAISRKCLLYIVLSGVSTALSWLFYYRALTKGDADKVMAIEKSSILVTLSAAVVLFGEHSHLPVKLTGMCVIAAGLYLLLKPAASEQEAARSPAPKTDSSGWLPYAFLAAMFSALNTIFAKLGVTGMSSSLATALNTSVVLPVVWAVVLLEAKTGFGRERNSKSLFSTVSGKEAFWIAVSGLTTGICWLCYYYAVKYGPITVVVPVNKLSVPIAVLYSHFVFGEQMKPRERAGMTGIVCGMLAVAVLG